MKISKSARGFTLIEVLAATAIMSIVVLVVLGLTTTVLGVWNRSTGKLKSNYEARVALDIMANDFETMVLRNRAFCWIQVDYAPPSSPSLDYTGALPDMPEMYFMARVEDRPRYSSVGGVDEPVYGDICAVSYRVIYQNPVNPTDTNYLMFGLYRFVIDSERTFTTVMDTTDDTEVNDLKTKMEESKYLDEVGEESSSAVSDINTVINKSENFLAANIVDLQVIFFYTNSANQQIAITSDGTDETDPVSFTYTDRLNIGGTPVTGTLEYVDIAITVMSPDGLAIMESKSTDATEWNDLVAQYGTTFSRRVQIMAKPL